MKWEICSALHLQRKSKWKYELDLASLEKDPMMGVWDEPPGSLKSRKCLEQQNTTSKKNCKMLLGLHILHTYIHTYIYIYIYIYLNTPYIQILFKFFPFLSQRRIMAYCTGAYHLTLQIYFHVVHSVYCDLIYKLYQHQQMHNSIYYVLYY